MFSTLAVYRLTNERDRNLSRTSRSLPFTGQRRLIPVVSGNG
jgi:hypothetical protein